MVAAKPLRPGVVDADDRKLEVAGVQRDLLGHVDGQHHLGDLRAAMLLELVQQGPYQVPLPVADDGNSYR